MRSDAPGTLLQIDWLVFPGCHPADLGTRLEARGMVGGPGGTWMLTELPARPSPFAIPERFRIEQVRTLEMLDVWRQVSAKGGYVQIQTAADCHPAVGAPEAGGDACAALGQC